MKINIPKFEDLLKKATVNYLVDFVQLNITPDKITAGLISSSKDVISILNIDNDIILDLKEGDELEWNWFEPNQNVVPYLRLFDDDIADAKEQKEKLSIQKGSLKSKLNFSATMSNKIWNTQNTRDGVEFFYTVGMDEDFIEAYDKIKKIGTQHGKIYFTVEDKKLYIETTDKTNTYSNGLKFEIDKVDDQDEDFSMCFNYKNFTSLMSVLSDETDFSISLAYVHEQGLGMAYVTNISNSERYFLMSFKET